MSKQKQIQQATNQTPDVAMAHGCTNRRLRRIYAAEMRKKGKPILKDPMMAPHNGLAEQEDDYAE